MLSFSETADAPAGGEALPDGLTLQTLPGRGRRRRSTTWSSPAARGKAPCSSIVMGAADLFTPGRIETMARDFETLLARVAADPDVPLSRLRELINPASG